MSDQQYWQQKSFDSTEPVSFEAYMNSDLWRPKEGKKRWWFFSKCPIQCTEKILLEETCDVNYENHVEVPEPEIGYIYIMQTHKLLRTSKVTTKILRCERCGAEWYQQFFIRSNQPMNIISWLRMSVNGVIVHDTDIVDEKMVRRITDG